MNILNRDLKRLEKEAVPEALRACAEKDPDGAINVAPELLALSKAISLKRIADILDDGLIHLTPDGKILGLADIQQKGQAPTINNLTQGKK